MTNELTLTIISVLAIHYFFLAVSFWYIQDSMGRVLSRVSVALKSPKNRSQLEHLTETFLKVMKPVPSCFGRSTR